MQESSPKFTTMYPYIMYIYMQIKETVYYVICDMSNRLRHNDISRANEGEETIHVQKKWQIAGNQSQTPTKAVSSLWCVDCTDPPFWGVSGWPGSVTTSAEKNQPQNGDYGWIMVYWLVLSYISTYTHIYVSWLQCPCMTSSI